jgi:hypothetical protein
VSAAAHRAPAFAGIDRRGQPLACHIVAMMRVVVWQRMPRHASYIVAANPAQRWGVMRRRALTVSFAEA